MSKSNENSTTNPILIEVENSLAASESDSGTIFTKQSSEDQLNNAVATSKRARNQPQRYGVREEDLNDDALFANVNDEHTKESKFINLSDENNNSDLSWKEDDKENTSTSDVENQSSFEKQPSKRQRPNAVVQSKETQPQSPQDDTNDDDLYRLIELQPIDSFSLNNVNDKNGHADNINSQIDSSKQQDQSQWSLLSPGEKVLFYKIIEMTKEIKILQRAVTGIQVNCNHAKKLAEKLEIGSVNDAAMQELGLPLCDEKQIVEFNKKLENADFFSKVV